MSMLEVWFRQSLYKSFIYSVIEIINHSFISVVEYRWSLLQQDGLFAPQGAKTL